MAGWDEARGAFGGASNDNPPEVTVNVNVLCPGMAKLLPTGRVFCPPKWPAGLAELVIAVDWAPNCNISNEIQNSLSEVYRRYPGKI